MLLGMVDEHVVFNVFQVGGGWQLKHIKTTSDLFFFMFLARLWSCSEVCFGQVVGLCWAASGYNAILNSCAGAGQWQQILQILDDLRSAEVRTNAPWRFFSRGKEEIPLLRHLGYDIWSYCVQTPFLGDQMRIASLLRNVWILTCLNIHYCCIVFRFSKF